MSEFHSIPNSHPAYERQVNTRQVRGPHPAEETSALQAGQARQKLESSNGKQAQSIPQSTKTKLKFRVDRESNEVTVLILDARSHKVIRTVPPEELSELTPGELIDLSR